MVNTSIFRIDVVSSNLIEDNLLDPSILKSKKTIENYFFAIRFPF